MHRLKWLARGDLAPGSTNRARSSGAPGATLWGGSFVRILKTGVWTPSLGSQGTGCSTRGRRSEPAITVGTRGLSFEVEETPAGLNNLRTTNGRTKPVPQGRADRVATKRTPITSLGEGSGEHNIWIADAGRNRILAKGPELASHTVRPTPVLQDGLLVDEAEQIEGRPPETRRYSSHVSSVRDALLKIGEGVLDGFPIEPIPQHEESYQ